MPAEGWGAGIGLVDALLDVRELRAIGINLAVGAVHMARRKVIVKQLAVIENFGSMNLLCADKTGTLTEGVVRLHSALDASGRESEKAHLYAYLNAAYESGFKNPIDGAIRGRQGCVATNFLAASGSTQRSTLTSIYRA